MLANRAEARPGPAPIQIQDGHALIGTLQGIEPGEDEGEIVVTVEGIRASVSRELENKLRGMIGKDVIVAHVDGKWRTCLWKGWRD
jgi:hypothetical protein